MIFDIYIYIYIFISNSFNFTIFHNDVSAYPNSRTAQSFECYLCPNFHNDNGNDQKKIGGSVPQLKDPSDPFSVGLEFSHRSVWIPGEDNDVRCSWILDLFEHILLILWLIHILTSRIAWYVWYVILWSLPMSPSYQTFPRCSHVIRRGTGSTSQPIRFRSSRKELHRRYAAAANPLRLGKGILISTSWSQM